MARTSSKSTSATSTPKIRQQGADLTVLTAGRYWTRTEAPLRSQARGANLERKPHGQSITKSEKDRRPRHA
jgi:hypothetical protein